MTPEIESTPVVLTEAEIAALAAAFARSTRSPEHLAFLAAPAVERILADRHAALLAEVAASRETGARAKAEHREEWASYFESWDSAVGVEPVTAQGVIKALRWPVVPFGTACADPPESALDAQGPQIEETEAGR